MQKITSLKVGKLQVAKEQINAAIEMLFRGMHPVSVHTVTAAGFRILRDLAQREKSPIRSLDFSHLDSKGERELWNLVNSSTNFFKHADKDPDGTFELSHETNDVVIYWAICVFRELTDGAFTVEMISFLHWFALQSPELVRNGPVRDMLQQDIGAFGVERMNREVLLKTGNEMLGWYRKHGTARPPQLGAGLELQ